MQAQRAAVPRSKLYQMPRDTSRRRQTQSPEIPPGRAEVTVSGGERLLAGPLASVSDFLFRASEVPVVLGSLTSAALLGYHVAVRAESLKEITPLQLLLYRPSYTPAAAYELFDELGPQGRSEYQYLNAMSTGLFPFLVALFFSAIIGRAFQRAGLGHDWNIFPFVFSSAATVESLGVSWLLYSFPELHLSAAAAVGMVGSLKWRFLWYTGIMAIVGVVWAGKCSAQAYWERKRR